MGIGCRQCPVYFLSQGKFVFHVVFQYCLEKTVFVFLRKKAGTSFSVKIDTEGSPACQ